MRVNRKRSLRVQQYRTAIPGARPNRLCNRDRRDWKQQTLLNIVKLRYGDIPNFLEVTQVIAGYQFQSAVAAGFNAANASSSNIGPFVVGGTLSAQGQYTDRPTLTYSPLTGPDFIKKLMTPIPPLAFLSLLQSGYSADRIMSIMIELINGIGNEAQRGRLNRAANPTFSRLAKLLYDQQLAGALKIRIEHLKGSPETGFILLDPSKDPEVVARNREIRSILGLRPDLTKVEVHDGGSSGGDTGVDMTMRSMLLILTELAADVRVPASDVEAGNAFPGLVLGQADSPQVPPLIKILSGDAEPRGAFVAVKYQGRWFWVPNTDIQSKFTFAYLQLVYTMSDTGIRATPAQITVPTQ